MIRRYLKIFATTAALVLAVSCFSGCGKKANDKDEQGRTILSVGEWPSKEGTELDNQNAKKARFEEANSDVVIQPDMWTFDRKTFYAKAAGGQLPGYFRVGFTEIAEIINSEYSADLTDVVKKRGYEGMFNPDVLEVISTEDGRIMALPQSAYVLGLAYDTELFKAAGLMEADGTPKQSKDWNEVAEFAVKIKEATGQPGIVLNTSNKSGGWIFTAIAWSFGVDFMEKDENGKWQATFNTPECAEALQWVKDLKWKYDVVPSNTLVNSEEAYKLFATGNGAMLITAGDIAGKVAKYGMKPDSLGMMAMPAGPKRHVTLLGGSLRCVNPVATEAQIDAAIRWHETENTFEVTDEYITNIRKDRERETSEGMLVGIKNMSTWSSQAPSLQALNAMIDEYANSNPNHVKLYNEFVADCPAEIQAEEPVCCQELYEILDACIQEVLSNKDADCAELLKKANTDFQKNYLDNLTY